MGLVDYLILALLAGMVLFALLYIVRAKKRGVKCIGCPMGGKCGADGTEGCKGCTLNGVRSEETRAEDSEV